MPRLVPTLTLACAVALSAPVHAQVKLKQPVAVPVIVDPVAQQPALPPPSVRRYRVTITGVVVEEPTWDDAMQRDGKDDEIYVVAESRLVHTHDGSVHVEQPQSVRSMVLGDINGFQPEERLQAGTASSDGGLRAGDKIGTTGMRTREPRGDRIPLLAWEGELPPETSVMIVPTVWEFDGEVTDIERLGRNLLGPLDMLGSSFDVAGFERGPAQKAGHREFPQFVRGEIRRYSETAVGRDVVGTNVTQEHTVAGVRADRPIGMENIGGNYRFDPWVLTLSHATAESVAFSDMGFGAGVLRLPYVDAPALRGRYQLFLQVEQLP